MTALRATLILPNCPASWPSVSPIQLALTQMLKKSFPNLQELDFLRRKYSAPLRDNFWIFPIGTVQTVTLKWLRDQFPNPSMRPPGLFFLGGEGAKLGYHILHFKDVFRADDQWLVSCQAEKDLLDFWFPGNNRTHVMYYPVSPEFTPVAKPEVKRELRKKLGLPIRKKLILYAGRLSQQKNVLSLLDFLESSSELTLLICGDVDSVGVPHLLGTRIQHVPSELTERLFKSGLSERVLFRPFQSQAQLSLIMQACDYQISLSAHYGEDYGYSIAQGLFSGLKTVASYWGGHRNWQRLATEKQLSYVELDWTKNTDVGSPILPSGFKLPKIFSAKNFATAFQTTNQNQLQTALDGIDTDAGKIQVLPVISDFWKTVGKNPRSHMFMSTQDPLFQAVVAAYRGPYQNVLSLSKIKSTR